MYSNTTGPKVRRFFEGGLAFRDAIAIQVPWVVSSENAAMSRAYGDAPMEPYSSNIASWRDTYLGGNIQASRTWKMKSASNMAAAMLIALALLSFDSSELSSSTTGIIWLLARLPMNAKAARLSPFSTRLRAWATKGLIFFR